MKKCIVLCLALFCFTQVFSQDTRFGVRGGLNLSNFFADEPDDTNLRPGFNIGITTKSSLLDEMLYLQAELGYSTKGARVEGDLGEASLNLGYIDVPVLLSLSFANTINLEGGVYAGYLVNTSISGESSNGISFSEEIDRDNFKKLDYGIVGGANIELSPITIGVRYNNGLQNIMDEEVASILGSDVRNSVFQLYVALSF